MFRSIKKFGNFYGMIFFALLGAVIAGCAGHPGDGSSPQTTATPIDIEGSMGGPFFRYLPTGLSTGKFLLALDDSGSSLNGVPIQIDDKFILLGYSHKNNATEAFSAAGIVGADRISFPVSMQGSDSLLIAQMRNGVVIQWVLRDSRYQSDAYMSHGPTGESYIDCTLVGYEYRAIGTSWIQGLPGDRNNLSLQGDQMVRVTQEWLSVSIPKGFRGTPVAYYNGVRVDLSPDPATIGFWFGTGHMVSGTATFVSIVGLDANGNEVDRLDTTKSTFYNLDNQSRTQFAFNVSQQGLISRLDINSGSATQIFVAPLSVVASGSSQVLRALGDFVSSTGNVHQWLDVTQYASFSSSNTNMLVFSGSRMTAGSTGGYTTVTVSYGSQSRIVDVFISGGTGNTGTNPSNPGSGSTGTNPTGTANPGNPGSGSGSGTGSTGNSGGTGNTGTNPTNPGAGGQVTSTILGPNRLTVGQVQQYYLSGTGTAPSWGTLGMGANVNPQSGVVTAVSAGLLTLFCVRDGTTYSMAVTVDPPGVTNIVTTTVSGPVAGGAVVQFTSTLGGPLTWSVSDTTLATIDNNGRMITIAAPYSGVVTVTAVDANGNSGSAQKEIWNQNGVSASQRTAFWRDDFVVARLGVGSVSFVIDVLGGDGNPFNTNYQILKGANGADVVYRVMANPQSFTPGQVVNFELVSGNVYIPGLSDSLMNGVQIVGGRAWLRATVLSIPQ